jgi:hypothetical protein
MGGRQEMLQVVDQQQHLHLLQVPGKGLHQRPARRVFDPERLGEDRRNEIRVLQRRQGHEGDAVGKIPVGTPCHLQGQPGLADAPGTGQGQKPHVVATQQGRHVLHFALAPDERSRGHGKDATGKLGSGASSGWAPGRGFELGEIGALQLQDLGKLLHGVSVRTPSLPTLEESYGLGRKPRLVGQVFLGEVSRGSVAPQQIAELEFCAGLYPSHLQLLSRPFDATVTPKSTG